MNTIPINENNKQNKDTRKGQGDFTGNVDNSPDNQTSSTQAQKIVTLIIGHPDMTLWHDSEGESYLTAKIDGHEEHMKLNSHEFKLLVSGLYYKENSRPPNNSALNDALNVLEYEALRGDKHTTFIRVATLENKIYIDLCDDIWRAVEITAQGVQIVNNPPIKFTRNKNMLPLPEPKHGGSLNLLRNFIRTDEKDFVLIIGFLLKCLYSTGAFPILLIYGEQGSGKTFQSKLIKRIIDPHVADTRSTPRDVKGLYVGATGSWLLVFDNITYLNKDLSDAFCTLATGNANPDRKLYSNGDEFILKAKRPVIMNGIAEMGAQPDFLDRAVSVTFKKIEDSERITEKELERRFAEILPLVMGALYDMAARGLANIANITLERLPRLADFAEWITACEPDGKRGNFIKLMFENRDEIRNDALMSDPVGLAIVKLMETRDEWYGTSSMLLSALDSMNIARGKHWPTEAKALGHKLAQISPLLQTANLAIEKERSSNERTITIRKITSQTSSLSPIAPLQGKSYDNHKSNVVTNHTSLSFANDDEHTAPIHKVTTLSLYKQRDCAEHDNDDNNDNENHRKKNYVYGEI